MGKRDLIKALRLLAVAFVVVLAGLTLVACGDDDEQDINEVLTGSWVLDKSQADGRGYVVESDEVYDLLVDHLEFHADGTFYIKYDAYDSDSGTFEAAKDYIRFDYADSSQHEEGSLLWEVMSFTETTLTAHYKDADHDITVTVYLKKQ